FPKMVATKDSHGSGEVAAGNQKQLHLGTAEAMFMKQPENETAEAVQKKLDEQYQKYKFMELKLAQKKRRLKGQIPEIKQTLKFEEKKEPTSALETRFLLVDNLYCKPPTHKMCLWLGLNVMLECDIVILMKMRHCLDFLQYQLTTTEVSMAGVYNWDIKRRNKDDSTKNKA
uniref:Uncharacterized protein n=1 Tax=Mustela putorius furo TaxID=9669 RepID=M3Z127_MUSPF